MLTPNIFHNLLSQEADISHNLRFLDNEDTFNDATIASFRWVLNNEERRPPEDAYKDPWLSNIHDTDSEGDTMSDSSASEGSQENEISLNNFIKVEAWIDQAFSAMGGKAVDKSTLNETYDDQRSGKSGATYRKVLEGAGRNF